VRQALAAVGAHVASNVPLSAALGRLGQAVEAAANKRDIVELAEAVDDVDNIPVLQAKPKTPQQTEQIMNEAHLASVVSALAHITDGLDSLGERLEERGQHDEDITQFIVWARRTAESAKDSMFKRIPVAKKLQKAAKAASAAGHCLGSEAAL